MTFQPISSERKTIASIIINGFMLVLGIQYKVKGIKLKKSGGSRYLSGFYLALFTKDKILLTSFFIVLFVYNVLNIFHRGPLATDSVCHW